MIQNKTVLAVVPARGGSKGVPRKNLRLVKGKSLLARTIEEAHLSAYIDRVIVSSEDDEIIAEARRAGADVPFVRPAALAQDDTAGPGPILHALTQVTGFDYVVVLQVTSPLRQCIDIDACIDLCVEHDAPACVSVTESAVSPHWMFAMGPRHSLLPVMSGELPPTRQSLPVTCSLNGAVYVAQCRWFQQYQRFLSKDTIGYLMPKERSLDIDTEFDFKLLEFFLQAHD